MEKTVSNWVTPRKFEFVSLVVSQFVDLVHKHCPMQQDYKYKEGEFHIYVLPEQSYFVIPSQIGSLRTVMLENYMVWAHDPNFVSFLSVDEILAGMIEAGQIERANYIISSFPL